MSKYKQPELGRPTNERLAKSAGHWEVPEGRGALPVMRMRDCPLDKALRIGLIGQSSHKAGEKYRHHWFHAGLAGTMTSPDMDGVFSNGSKDFLPKSENQIFHRQKFAQAGIEVGNRTNLVLCDAICNELELFEIGKKLGYASEAPARAAATELFVFGLDRLAKLWGL